MPSLQGGNAVQNAFKSIYSRAERQKSRKTAPHSQISGGFDAEKLPPGPRAWYTSPWIMKGLSEMRSERLVNGFWLIVGALGLIAFFGTALRLANAATYTQPAQGVATVLPAASTPVAGSTSGTASTWTVALPANPSRRGCTIQVPGTTAVSFATGSTTPSAAEFTYTSTTGAFSCVDQQQVWVMSGSATQAYQGAQW